MCGLFCEWSTLEKYRLPIIGRNEVTTLETYWFLRILLEIHVFIIAFTLENKMRYLSVFQRLHANLGKATEVKVGELDGISTQEWLCTISEIINSMSEKIKKQEMKTLWEVKFHNEIVPICSFTKYSYHEYHQIFQQKGYIEKSRNFLVIKINNSDTNTRICYVPRKLFTVFK